jgi:predicted DNA-binding protein YlxM (UPF0122 family)
MPSFPSYFATALFSIFKAILVVLWAPAGLVNLVLQKCGVKPFDPAFRENNLIDLMQQLISDLSINALVRWDRGLARLPNIEELRRDLSKAREFAREYAAGNEPQILFIDYEDGRLSIAPYAESISGIRAALQTFEYHKVLLDANIKRGSIFRPIHDLAQMLSITASIDAFLCDAYAEERKPSVGFKFDYNTGIQSGAVDTELFFPEILVCWHILNLRWQKYLHGDAIGITSFTSTPDTKEEPIKTEPKTPIAQSIDTPEPGDPQAGKGISIAALGPKKTDLSDQLAKHAHSLTNDQMECISLKLEWGLSSEEIAQRRGTRRQAVDKLLAKALRKINNSNANEKKKHGVNRGVIDREDQDSYYPE